MLPRPMHECCAWWGSPEQAARLKVEEGERNMRRKKYLQQRYLVSDVSGATDGGAFAATRQSVQEPPGSMVLVVTHNVDSTQL